MDEINYYPIGIIHSEHTNPKQTPIQPVFAGGCKGTAEILPEYLEGLTDIDGFSHLYLLYSFHRAESVKLMVKPFLENVEHGIFATRAPCRPNAIGLSIVKLVKREDNILYLDDLDILDGTPLLDIKPYTAKFDCQRPARSGWQDKISPDVAECLGRRDYRK